MSRASGDAMVNPHIDLSFEGSRGSVLPSQYGDLYRRHRFNGEHRLLCAVLEEAIKNYLSNTKRSTREQRTDFEEVRNWFHVGKEKLQGLFSFRSICDLLEIDSGLLLNESIRPNDLPKRSTGRASRRLAA